MENQQRQAIFLVAVLCAVTLGGCSRLLGNLRKDVDESEWADAPTVGGRWAERGMLASEEYSQYSSYADRAPAGLDAINGAQNRGQGWVSEAQREANRRDLYRGMDLDPEDIPAVTYSQVQNFAPPVKRAYQNGQRATRADFTDDAGADGSLWAGDGQSNFFFSKNKVRTVGDIITVTAEDGLIKDMGYEIRRTLTPPEREQELKLAETRLREKSSSDKLKTSSAAPADPKAKGDAKKEEVTEEREVTYADIDVAQSLEVKSGDTLMGEILERYPNGNYKVRAVKKVVYKNGPPRMVSLLGIVKGSDITEEDTVTSGKLYEYRLEASR